MTILIVLIPLGLLMLGVAVAAFVWAVSNGQYDDLEGEGSRILFDEDPIEPVAGVPEPASRGDR